MESSESLTTPDTMIYSHYMVKSGARAEFSVEHKERFIDMANEHFLCSLL